MSRIKCCFYVIILQILCKRIQTNSLTLYFILICLIEMKLLILDDIEPNLKLLALTVKKLDNIEVFPFTSPIEAVKWCEKNEPDIILTDYLMPEMTGLEFIKTLKEEFGYDHVLTIMITAFDEKEVKHAALELGVNDFINKPIDTKEILAKVKNYIKIREYDIYLQDRNKWLKDQVNKATKSIKEREVELIHKLVAMAEYREQDTGYHINRVAHYSRLIADGLHLDTEEVELIFLAAPMHDIGKVGIPDKILLKPGKLTEEEFEIIKSHTTIGYDILKNSESDLIKKGAVVALTHHEKWDGTGYPNNLKGEDIPLEGQIVAVADVFDALTSKRPYKDAWTFEKAVEYIESAAGSHFSPKCAEVFISNKKEVLSIYNKFTSD